MKPIARYAVIAFLSMLIGCIDPIAPRFNLTADVLVVDGTITDRAEPQRIRLNRSAADRFTGRFGDTPLTGARVTVRVNDDETITAREVSPGTYQLPDGFRGRVGNRYQLQLELADGMRYASSTETMPAVSPILTTTDVYNPRSLTGQLSPLTAANDLFIDTQDPAGTPNYYRWDWVLWEKQDFCQTCGNDQVYYERDDAGNLVEKCMPNRIVPLPFPRPQNIDYECRTQCWEILYSSQLSLFSDALSDGKRITNRRVAQIPFYQYYPALVEIRQSALTAEAYRYFRRLDEQSQQTGGLTDTPPAAPVGNIRNLSNDREEVVGYFTASGVSAVRYWLTRRNVTNELPASPADPDRPKLFTYLNGRTPYKEPVSGIRGRPPLALCVPGPTRTPIKPEGWQE
ncbi:DUF4249 domain-containing protein [Spirosoma montaniterrae]|uniref:DUF4249 domain-containing protein n=1 Tax=Spirosoma montaniterrae TaxID=1178516 RepID=A0A1P9WVV9_9BACT|nr:DUF4249 domain-containing protein [Spirosoma montaniterrae]AQG79517.1 hypothetical protein AWR27_09405 [Spirosoma montaniterrae]